LVVIGWKRRTNFVQHIQMVSKELRSDRFRLAYTYRIIKNHSISRNNQNVSTE